MNFELQPQQSELVVQYSMPEGLYMTNHQTAINGSVSLLHYGSAPLTRNFALSA